VLTQLYAALGRIARMDAAGDPVVVLAAAAREAARLASADLVVLRVAGVAPEVLSARVPVRAVWPPDRVVGRWAVRAAGTRRPAAVSPSTLRRAGLRGGVALPVASMRGTVGVLAAFSATQPRFSAEQCAVMLLPVEAAVAGLEITRMRRETEAIAGSEAHERIVRRIHDGPLQALSGITLHLRLIRLAADEKMRDPLRGLETELEQVIRQVREFIRTLRDPHPQASLEKRVCRVLDRLEQTRGLACSLQWREPVGALTAAAADELFHVINEALANVYRHSAARRVDVLGRARGRIFEVVVRDDGVGFDLSRALRQDMRNLSFGLFSMRERVNALGGLLTLRSQPGRGTRVLIQIPIERVESRGSRDGRRPSRSAPGRAGVTPGDGEQRLSPTPHRSRLRRISGPSS
jgi:signal transduction histidine kinase